MIQQALVELFERDLNKLIEEINLYKDEADIWIVKGTVTNSAGNLCLHLVGNLNHFIGATLGNTGYVRDRDSEFSTQYVPREELIASIGKTIAVVKNTLANLPNDKLEAEFPLEVAGRKPITGQFLIHLFGHLGYHLGQVNYHRRMLERQA